MKLTRSRTRGGTGGGRILVRLVLWMAALVVLVVLLPYGLVLVYASPGVHPVSMPMIADRLTGREYKREWIPFDRIAPVLVESVMMSEDGRFCEHEGVDWSALDKVINMTLDGDTSRGASTIPMQVVKNLFLWQSHSYIRKALEIPLALYADRIWTKKRIMEIYLNVAEWAPGIYGVGAAARYLYGTSADRIGPRQAALLAVTLPDPEDRNPSAPSRELKKLARTIEARARQSGAYIKCLYPSGQ